MGPFSKTIVVGFPQRSMTCPATISWLGLQQQGSPVLHSWWQWHPVATVSMWRDRVFALSLFQAWLLTGPLLFRLIVGKESSLLELQYYTMKMAFWSSSFYLMALTSFHLLFCTTSWTHNCQFSFVVSSLPFLLCLRFWNKYKQTTPTTWCCLIHINLAF